MGTRILRPATLADLPEISTLVNSAYRGESSRAGWTTEADFLEGQRTDLESLGKSLTKGTILCLRRDGDLIGCVYLEKNRTEFYLGMLTVRPDLQAGGLGREILEGAEDFARQNGAESIRLQVLFIRESLIAWYQRRGYRANGQTKPFGYGDERFGIPLRSDLYFIQFVKSLTKKSPDTAHTSEIDVSF